MAVCVQNQWPVASRAARQIKSRVTRRGYTTAALYRALLPLTLVLWSSLVAHANIVGVSVQSPQLSTQAATNVTTPVHFEATAESDLRISGFVIYVDGSNVYRNFSPSLDAWVVLRPGSTHSVSITTWDSSGQQMSTATYSISITGVAPPVPPTRATRMANIDKPSSFFWTVDNDNGVGGQCNHGSMGTFQQGSDPNTADSPDFDGNGQHFILKSQCQ